MDSRALIKLITRIVNQMVAPLARRVRLVASRGTITAVNDTDGVQTCQVTLLSGERISDVQVVQMFGSSGHTLPGATCVVLCMGGSRSHPVVIALDHPAHRFRDLEPGEWVAYNAVGDFIRLKSDGTAHVKAALKVLLETPLSHCTGDLHADGNVSDGAGTMATMRVQHNSHNHPTAAPGAPSPPSVLMS